jgi:hypothetical protein
MRFLIFTVALLLLLPARASESDTAPIGQDDDNKTRRIALSVGGHLSAPLGVSASGSLFAGRITGPISGSFPAKAFELQLEVGTGGAKVGLGWAFGGCLYDTLFFPVPMASVRIVAFRSFDNAIPSRIAPDNEYLGLELAFPVTMSFVFRKESDKIGMLSGRAGYLQRVGGNDASQEHLFTIGVGWRY